MPLSEHGRQAGELHHVEPYMGLLQSTRHCLKSAEATSLRESTMIVSKEILQDTENLRIAKFGAASDRLSEM